MAGALIRNQNPRLHVGGGSGALLSPDVFHKIGKTQATANAARLGQNLQDPGVQQAQHDELARLNKEEDEMKTKQMWTSMAENLQALAQGRKNPPSTFSSITDGFQLKKPAMFERDPIPLPFDMKYNTELNLKAVIDSIGGKRYQLGEEAQDALLTDMPKVQKALNHAYSIYENVPKSFYVNRLYIARSRKLQDSVYGM